MRPGQSRAPFAVRNRRVRDDGFVREEIVWGRSFAEIAGAKHGTMQVTGIVFDGKGLSVAPVGMDGVLAGPARLEVALPLRPGHAWEIPVSPEAPGADGTIERVEEIDTPAGKVRALRVSLRVLAGDLRVATLWYDRGLRPVRMEFRDEAPSVVSTATVPR